MHVSRAAHERVPVIVREFMTHLIVNYVSVVHAPLLVLYSAIDLAVAQVHGEVVRNSRVLGRMEEQPQALAIIRLEQVRMKKVEAAESNLRDHRKCRV